METSIINAANVTLKSVAQNLRDGNREFNSLSSVLKEMQKKCFMKYYAPCFEAVGMEASGQLTPAMIFAVLSPEQQGVTRNKKGEQVGDAWYGIWGVQQKKDAQGRKMFEADGKTPIVENVLRKVSSWSPNKLFKILAQAQAIKAAK